MKSERCGRPVRARVVAAVAAVAATTLIGVSAPVAADRGGLTEVWSATEDSYPFGASRDLSTLLVGEGIGQSFVSVNVETGASTALSVPKGGSPRFAAMSTNGNVLAFTAAWEGVIGGDADGRLADGFLYNTQTASLQLITAGSNDAVHEVLALSGDGSTAVIVSFPLFDALTPSFSLWQNGTSTPLPLPDYANSYGSGMTLSDDGSTLLFSRFAGGAEVLYARNLANGTTEVIGTSDGIYGASMSDDGSIAAWTRNDEAPSENGFPSAVVEVWNTETGVLSSFDLDKESAGSVATSGDGQKVSGIGYEYGSEGYQGAMRLWQLDVASGSFETLASAATADFGGGLLGSNADGSRLLFQTSGGGIGSGLPIEPGEWRVAVYAWDASGTPSASSIAHPALGDQVKRLYEAYFGRQPDPAGLDHWLGQRALGVPLNVVSEAFAASPEFVATYGDLNNAQFVTLIYNNVLGRQPDAGGLAFWTERLTAGATRGEVMAGFSESNEFVAATGTAAPMSATEGALRRMYLVFFGRTPVDSELDGWVERVANGQSLQSVADVFATTQEYQDNYGQADNYVIFDLTVRRVLGRFPTDEDYNRWLVPLENNLLSIAQFLFQLGNQPEYVERTGTTPIAG